MYRLRCSRRRRLGVVAGLILMVAAAPLQGGVFYVDASATGANNGSSWTGFVYPLPITSAGTLTLAGFWPIGLPPGITLYFQEWFADPQAVQGFAASNAVSGTTP